MLQTELARHGLSDFVYLLCIHNPRFGSLCHAVGPVFGLCSNSSSHYKPHCQPDTIYAPNKTQHSGSGAINTTSCSHSQIIVLAEEMGSGVLLEMLLKSDEVSVVPFMFTLRRDQQNCWL